MGNAVFKYTRNKSTANWSNVSDVQSDITTDTQAISTNSQMSAINDWFMLGQATTVVTYINTTSAVVTQTFDEVLMSNTTFMGMHNHLDSGSDTSSNQYKLKQDHGYTFSTANVEFSNGHSYVINNNVFG
jgi:cystathionine beta-lyase/cystathionine gamma-synthase